jgi:hypothetical protein
VLRAACARPVKRAQKLQKLAKKAAHKTMQFWPKPLPAVFLFCASLVVHAAAAPLPPRNEATVTCDVIIAGGSLASLAAAVSAANYSSAATICFLDPTDWPGGQLTASAVPAVDFGPHNRDGPNVPRSFASFLFGEAMPGDVNLGDCWVSQPLSCTSPPALIFPP